ncbi:MAG: nad binding 3-hydroxyacyl-CoA dehydrogenase [Olpidium bornovanus]|uniref:Nad binding 3-hydroxyacyl-CoA dehydrogenase n=1 Tax=Olpidium bornovanus TaxID=278681 RepID=A0A8H7ZSV1_9FUNG|nr:MAG: nad binding 3-hydroxyacyl-CoA dehydrogenase [Olpidium bornovanus]
MSGRARPALSLFARRPPSSSFSTSAGVGAAQPVKNVVVVGSGLMGAGIAQVAAQSGLSVTMCDVSAEAVKKGEAQVAASLTRAARKAHPDDAAAQERFAAAALANLKTSANSAAAAADADLVVEAVVEDLARKQELFERLDAAAPPHAVFATNTSSLPVAAIAARVRRRDRFGGLHFFNPVPQMRLVEVVRTPDTSDDTYDTLVDVARKMKKTPVTCKDTPG